MIDNRERHERREHMPPHGTIILLMVMWPAKIAPTLVLGRPHFHRASAAKMSILCPRESLSSPHRFSLIINTTFRTY